MYKKILIFLIILITIVFADLNFLSPVQAETIYQPLVPIDNVSEVKFSGTDSDLSNYINTLYKLAVGVAGVLAVLMIMWGGIEYMSTDAIGGKEEAKGRINNALLGLMLALGSYLILKTINADFLKTTLSIDTVTAPELEIQRLTKFEISTPNSAEETEIEKGFTNSNEVAVVDPNATDGSKRILQSALNAAGDGEGSISDTSVCGRLGCGLAGSTMLTNAGFDGYDGMLGTAQIASKLKTDSNFSYVGSNINNIQPGDVVMAATSGDKVGHFTISTGSGSNANLAGNSSSEKRVKVGWKAGDFQSYQSKNGLQLQIYRAK